MDCHLIKPWVLPWFEKALNWKHGDALLEKFDERMDLLAKLLALYPFTETEQLTKEFHLSEGRIKQLAIYYGVNKDQQTRSDINKKNGDNPRSRALLFLLNRKQKFSTKNTEKNEDSRKSF